VSGIPAVPPSAAREHPSISAALNGSDNALNLIRLVLASIVIVSHAFPLGGWGEDPVLRWTQGQANAGGIAVIGFFAISGYLIAKSGLRTDVVQFLWHRFLRIFPAFWVVLILTAFILGPILWMTMGRPLADYFTLGPGGPFAYVTENWTLRLGTWGIHDVLAGTPYGIVVNGSVFNGSLWTLWYEWVCYLIIAAFVLFGVLRRAKWIVALAAGFFLILQIAETVSPGAVTAVVPWFESMYVVNLGLPFLVGSTIAIYSRHVPFDNWFGIGALLMVGGTLVFGGFSTLGSLAGPYAVLWLAARLPQSFKRVGAKNDYSYGVYIYGFVVEQVVAFIGVQRFGWLPYVVLSLVLAFAMAWLSWHLVEKRALRLKAWGPGRGVRYWWDRAVEVKRRRRPADPGDLAQ